MPAVTVVISIYNGSQYIEDSIKYLSQQECRDFEVIFVIDSKTNDDTVEKINKSGMDLNHRIIIQNDGKGLGGARNIGLDVANGEYVWFLDVDDRPYPDFLSILVALVKKNDADIAICNFTRSSERNLPEYNKRYQVKVLNRVQAMNALMKDKIPVTAWSKIFRTDFLRKNGLRFFSGYSEDVDHTYKTINLCSKVVYCSKPLYLYYQNEDSLCTTIGNDRGLAEIRVYRDMIDTFDSTDMKEGMCRRSAIMMVRSAVHLDYEAYREYVKGDEFEEICGSCLRNPVSWEYICAKIFPKLYYTGMQFYLKFFYYREFRCYNRI